ncbi:hypothetical protein ABZ208_23160 [Streptomyces sp. NPDC006208]|uniref:hypothetical protein n=1 Tax=Streptomyces sp. NPDC006208 TaxID=3156734 RepID=UPI0033A78F3A
MFINEPQRKASPAGRERRAGPEQAQLLVEDGLDIGAAPGGRCGPLSMRLPADVGARAELEPRAQALERDGRVSQRLPPERGHR